VLCGRGVTAWVPLQSAPARQGESMIDHVTDFDGNDVEVVCHKPE
jgi:hypothetical protein